MHRAFADAVIVKALRGDPEHLSDVIANVARAFHAEGRYSPEEIGAAINDLLCELEAHLQPQH
jgi:hypothetical protein